MQQEQRINNKIILKLLEKLGNKEPTGMQIELVKSLLLRDTIEQQLFFHQKLTAREISCLLLAAKGKTVDDSAKLMNVKTSTVRTWRNKILSKLGCRSIAQAVFKSIHYGYLSAPSE